MAAAMDSSNFDSWLSKKLLNLNPDTDLEIFVQYITSILETETDNEERMSSIKDFLEQITEDDLEFQCNEIICKYTELEGTDGQSKEKGTLSFDEQMASALEKQKQQMVKTDIKTETKEDKERKKAKEAILQKFSQVSDGEVSDKEDEGEGSSDLVENVNTKLVIQRQMEERDKSKQLYANKKHKDKEDRERQKQKEQERKEAEKKRTQKGERRR